MGLREKLNQYPGVMIGVCAVAVMVAILLVVNQFRTPTPPGLTDRAWYTTDDGATWFADDAMNVPPFKRDGKDAVEAFVYKCPGKTFVAYVQRFTPEGVKMFGQAPPGGGLLRRGAVMVPKEFQEVKRPGASRWTKLSADSDALLKAISPTCPDGTTNGLEVVYP